MKLRPWKTEDDSKAGFHHWCPGCDQPHGIWIKNPGGAQWTFDGNMEAPTFAPSIRCFSTHDENGDPLPNGAQRTLCHYFIKAGRIEFCGDSPHGLAGRIVPLPEWPWS
jgi:hypothetical protein